MQCQNPTCGKSFHSQRNRYFCSRACSCAGVAARREPEGNAAVKHLVIASLRRRFKYFKSKLTVKCCPQCQQQFAVPAYLAKQVCCSGKCQRASLAQQARVGRIIEVRNEYRVRVGRLTTADRVARLYERNGVKPRW